MALMLLEVKTLVACRMSIVACVMYSARSPGVLPLCGIQLGMSCLYISSTGVDME